MPELTTPYGPINANFLHKLSKIKLLACDVDGVFSDGRIYMGQDGEELKAFHTRDGYGIKAIQNIGIQVAVITGRSSNMVEKRMTSLGVKHILQGCENKQPALESLQSQLGISTNATASIGDDMPDIGMFGTSGIKVCVADGHPVVQQNADYITHIKGGFGAVRELCDLILLANNKLDLIHGAST
ncbi:3-deoxy-manno-octulosonate-8-phosphatase KdsC [Paraglaciecola sp.]|uniref:3-deoxy-manno-octulosonate-8-phosphatase KdsC n=1 Tax=Paraglaciecola sp. TaxID=1920173 RepID=UPI003EFB0ED0